MTRIKTEKPHQLTCQCHAPGRREFVAAGIAAGVGLVLPAQAQGSGVQELSGSVFVNRKYASIGTPVRAGDLVTVAHGSSVSFTIDEDAYLLRGGTTLRLGSADSSLVNSLRLFTGAILGVFGRGEKMIVTRSATIGIRGTGLYLDTAPGQTYFCTCYGETELRVPGIKTQQLTATHHNAVMIYTPRSGKNKIHNMAGFEYHTDDELRAAEALQGRKVPFDS